MLGADIAAGAAAGSAADLAAKLRGAGIAAEPVLDAAALVADEQLASRGFFVAVEHPEWGRRCLVGVPWRPHGQAPLALRPPPRLAAGV